MRLNYNLNQYIKGLEQEQINAIFSGMMDMKPNVMGLKRVYEEPDGAVRETGRWELARGMEKSGLRCQADALDRYMEELGREPLFGTCAEKPVEADEEFAALIARYEFLLSVPEDGAEHRMNLRPEPFEKIKNGSKTIELRLRDEKRQKIKAGDTILFTNTAGGETLRAAVLQLHRFDSFEALYKALPLLKCGYTGETVADARPSDMQAYYSAAEQAKYGVVGIELSVVRETPHN